MRRLARSISTTVALAAFSLSLGGACTQDFKPPPGEKKSDEAKQDEAKPSSTAGAQAPAAPADQPEPAAVGADEGAAGTDSAEPAPAAKEPTTPKEIELARKTAMVEGRDQDVLKYCAMEGIESGKSDEQAIMGCTLSACRLKQTDKARSYAKGLGKALKKQARTICQANGVIL